MNIYTVKYWLPFPSSEYGGLQVWIAPDREALLQLILKDTDPYYFENYPDYLDIIQDKINRAHEFKLDDTKKYVLGLVAQMIT